MHIDWVALFKVAGVSLIFGVGIVCVFSVGLLALDEGAPAGSSDVAAARAASRARKAGAGACFLICAAAVLYGLWLIVPQFHR